jgi:hypothetical protein
MCVPVPRSYLSLEWPVGWSWAECDERSMRRSDFLRLSKLMRDMAALAAPDRMVRGDLYGREDKMTAADLAP